MEIEKKYLVKEIPFELDSYEKHEIIQCYLNPVQDGVERRVRKKNNKFYYTEKSFGDLVREENEFEISEDNFNNFLNEKVNNPIYKDRYHIPFNNFVIELDVYKDKLAGLITADVEFNSIEESESFKAPNWFDEDITYNKKLKNFNLARLNSINEIEIN